MTKKPWFKFYPTDWRDDEALRMCSIAARGLWLEMLCIMDRAQPRGFLLVKDKRPSIPQIATMAGITAQECAPLLKELEENGVFERRLDGTLFSRKMASEGAMQAVGRKNAEKRWDPDLIDEIASVDGGLTCARDQSPESRDSDRESSGESQSRKPRAKLAGALPEGFPDEESMAWGYDRCRQDGVEVNLTREAEKFRNHAEANGRRAKDWRAAWRTWVMRAVEYAPDSAKIVHLDQHRDPAEADLRLQRQCFENWVIDPADPRWGPPTWVAHPPGDPSCPIPASVMAEYGYSPGAEVSAMVRAAAMKSRTLRYAGGIR